MGKLYQTDLPQEASALSSGSAYQTRLLTVSNRRRVFTSSNRMNEWLIKQKVFNKLTRLLLCLNCWESDKVTSSSCSHSVCVCLYMCVCVYTMNYSPLWRRKMKTERVSSPPRPPPATTGGDTLRSHTQTETSQIQHQSLLTTANIVVDDNVSHWSGWWTVKVPFKLTCTLSYTSCQSVLPINIHFIHFCQTAAIKIWNKVLIYF